MASTAALPWHWVIETLADLKQADTSILRDLFSRVPNFSTYASKSTRERAALRYLEKCMGSGSAADAPATSGSESGIDVARSSEEVLCSFLSRWKAAGLCSLEKGGANRYSHDLRRFVLKKRAALAKSSLDLLKESILEGRNQAASSLKEYSGLSRPNIVITGDDDIRLLEKGSSRKPHSENNISLNDGQIQADAPSGSDQLLRLSSPPHPPCKEKISLCDNDHFDGEVSALRQAPTDGGGLYGMLSNLDLNDEISAAEKPLWSPHVRVDQDSIDGDRTEQGICIKCDKGGRLLSCSVSGCLISVHESCLGTLVDFKENGLFYCPFCSYNRAVAAYCKAGKSVSRAKKALSGFIGRDLVQGHKTKLPRETRQSGAIGNENHQHSFHSHQSHGDEPSDSFLKAKEHHQQEEADSVCNNCNQSSRYVEAALSNSEFSRNAVDYQGSAQVQHCQLSDATDTMNNDKLACDDNVTCPTPEKTDVTIGDGEVGNDSECVGLAEHHQLPEPHAATDTGNLPHEEANVYQIRVRNVFRDKGKDDISKRRSKRTRHDAAIGKIQHHQENVESPKRHKSSPGRCSKRVVQPKHYSSPVVSLGRRNKLFWTSEEEEALKDAVKKFDVDSTRNLPWTKIWEFGRHRFHISRQPGDLKDKWRNIREKERRKEET